MYVKHMCFMLNGPELTAAHVGSIGLSPYLGKKEHSGVTFRVYVFREDKLQ